MARFVSSQESVQPDQSDLVSPGLTDKLETGDSAPELEEEESYSLIDVVSRTFGSKIKWVVTALSVLGVTCFLVSACVLYAVNYCSRATDLLLLVYLTSALVLFALLGFIHSRYNTGIQALIARALDLGLFKQYAHFFWEVACMFLVAGALAIILLSTLHKPLHILSLTGWVFFFVLLIVSSKAPSKVSSTIGRLLQSSQ
ncbi:uncharacterized protein LOC131954759 [Physella acuta]|uniref:uncharacterized protein LOC131954759 n=1 Tax=Physella acuta TaxID=109671 RepID=UPI0027DBFD33|nr:uncharacterized protein LOC131954759 [Physella acuta]